MQRNVLILFSFLLLGSIGVRCEEVKNPATNVKRCADDKPFPLEVRVHGCIEPPCNVVKGTDAIFEIDFAVDKFITSMTTKVMATTLGFITVPYELPAEVAAVCPNLRFGAYCPLYATEDVTYLFRLPVASEYPEIGVKIELSVVDQDRELATCFICDIKVRKATTGNENYELNNLN